MSRILALLLAALLAGCAHLDPEAARLQVEQSVQQRIPAAPAWPADAAARAAEILKHPLDADAAVQLALLQHPDVAAARAELGQAEAEAVAAGLLKNPFLHLARIKSRTSGEATLDIGLSWDVLGLLSLTPRRQAADHGRELARLDAAARLLDIAARARAAWHAHLAARELVEWREEQAEAAHLMAEIARRLEAAGNQAGLARADAEAARIEARHALEDARAAGESSRLRLFAQLGLSPDTKPRFPERLPRLPGQDPTAPDAARLEAGHLELARLRAQRMRAEQLAAGVRATAWSSGLEIGWDWEREHDGEWKDGPALGIGLPLFDTGAARRAAAGFEVARLQARLDARRQSLLHQAAQAEHAMRQARARVESLREDLLPLLSDAQDRALLEYNAMHKSAAQLLDLKRRELDVLGRLVQGLDAYWQARAALEALHLGVSLELPEAARPAPAAMASNDGGH